MTALLNFYGCWFSLALMLAWGVRETLIRRELAQAEQLRAENERLDAEIEALEKESRRLRREATRAWVDLWKLQTNIDKMNAEEIKRRVHLAYDRINAMTEPALATEAKAGDA